MNKYVLTLEYKDDGPSVYGPFETWIDARDYRNFLLEKEEGETWDAWHVTELYTPELVS